VAAFPDPRTWRLSVSIITNRGPIRTANDTQPWSQETSPIANQWPGNYFRSIWGSAVAVRLLGDQTVDGVPSQVVAFVRPELPAWFRLWVGDTDGIVRWEDMLAEGHVMDHTWGSFNAPVIIEAPS
jgi:hypothetical protein